MNFKSSAQLLIAIGSLFLANVPGAELRKPNPAEQTAIDKYNKVMTGVLDEFRSDDWDESVDYALDDPYVNPNDPGVPLDINELMERTYSARQGGSRFSSLVQPLIDKMMQEQDMTAKMKAGASVQDLTHVKVSVHFNRANLGSIDPPPAQNHDLQIPGTAFAYKTKDNPTNHGSAFVLAFGDWKSAKWDAENNWYHFKFAHAQNTPYIENIQVEIFGADDRIQQLLHSIDWQTVNQALTR